MQLISSVGPWPNTKKLFLLLEAWDHELLSTPKITTFLANSLPKRHEHVPSNASFILWLKCPYQKKQHAAEKE